MRDSPPQPLIEPPSFVDPKFRAQDTHEAMDRAITVTVDPPDDWDAFAVRLPTCRLGHASAWAQVLRSAYGLRTHHLAARSAISNALAGVLPVVEFRDLLGRASLISMPFLDAAGPLSPEPEVASDLVSAACALARERKLRLVETRVSGKPEEAFRVNLAMPLEADPEAQWRRLGAKVRNQTRKAEREGLSLALGDSGALLDRFYAPYATNMRDLGSPAHSRRFFGELARAFGERMRFIVTERERRPVGGLVAVHFGDVVYVPWASTLRSERARCPNNQIYWEAIRWAIQRGAKRFDFGRSPPGSGTHRFKLGWGASEEPLLWERRSARGAAMTPSRGVGGAAGPAARVYASLPLPVANRLGPALRRYLSN
jgi:FemAB-related protein (PEP-CTERM system-associated)